jgi:type VI secretion system secreted protein VgrG
MKALPDFASLFGDGLSQHARLITLASAQESGLPQSLVVEHFAGCEAVNELFCFDVDALSVSTDLDLSVFMGGELTIGLLQPDGRRRAWHGICTQASWRGADGGFARYRLRLEPALSLLALRRDSYVFQGLNARDIVTELLADYPQVRFEFDVTQELAARAICTQYRESDFEFLVRLLASEGLSWRFEHDQPDDASSDGYGQARHRLVIFDSMAEAPAMARDPVIRFHGVRATEEDDAIDAFRARRQLSCNTVSISSWDPAQLLAPSAEQQSQLDTGEVPLLPLYDGSGERIATARGAADQHSHLMLQALELDNKVFEGGGAVRRLAAGHAFQLTQHEHFPGGEDKFTVLWVRHEARNNLRPGLADDVDSAVDEGTYRNTFACVRDTVAIVPAMTTLPHRATARGPQTALVVGLADAVSTTTRDHQVKIQFAWQRGTNPNAGGMAHETDADGCAPGDERSGTWVRVAEALAGPNWGTQFIPRIGTEVLVDFIEGDIDRPVIVAQLYTGSDLPPFSAGVDSEVEHAGVLSGIHSQNFDGSGFNQWQLDDTHGQLRMRLATSAASTQLNLGYLVDQRPGTAARGRYRGSGFELRTDAWAVVRGGEGVLLSTRARPSRGSGVTSAQMDAADAVSQLKAAQALGETLGGAAAQQQALFSKDAMQAQADFIEQLDPQAKGKFARPVNGTPAFKSSSGTRELNSAQPVKKFGTSLVLMDSAASINWATPASTVIYAGQQLHWTMQSDLQCAAACTLSSVAGNATTLFTHSGGIQTIAGNGPVSLQAHTDKLEVLSDAEVTVISVNDKIEISSKKSIVLQAGDASITLEGGDIKFACPGTFAIKGSQHLLQGGGSRCAELVPLPDSRAKIFKERIRAIDTVSGDPIVNLPYRIELGDGTEIVGRTDNDGKTQQVATADPTTLKVFWYPDTAGDHHESDHLDSEC